MTVACICRSVPSSPEALDCFPSSAVIRPDRDVQPSPPAEKTSFWGRSKSSSTASSHRTMLGENGQFSISRESFESYRRSFVRHLISWAFELMDARQAD